MRTHGVLAAGFGAGVAASLTYLLDPVSGGRRRARIRDAAAHTVSLTRRATDTAARDALHRATGTAATLRGLLQRDPAGDEVIVERVRAKLGRYSSHSHAIDVSASDGTVTLRGPILTAEADRLVNATSHVRGVDRVIDKLERHDRGDHISALQGGRTPAGPRMDILQQRWAPATRCAVATAGAALAGLALLRRDAAALPAALAGAAMLACATANEPLRRVVGSGVRERAIDVQKTITVLVPVGEVYAFWSVPENFPRFMSRVLQVTPSARDPQQSHWKVAGPAGVPVEFDAAIHRAVPNQVIEWHTLDGAPVWHAGTVRFDSNEDGSTRVQVRMAYSPPAGWLGHGVAAAFGADPKSGMDADLLRMKTLIETGRAPHDAAQRGASHTP